MESVVGVMIQRMTRAIVSGLREVEWRMFRKSAMLVLGASARR